MTVDSREREWDSQCGSHRDGARHIAEEWGFVRFVTARDFRRGAGDIARVPGTTLWVHARKVPSVVRVGRGGEVVVEAFDPADLVHVPRIAAREILFGRVGGIFRGHCSRVDGFAGRFPACVQATTIVIKGRRPWEFLDELSLDQFTEVDEVVPAVDYQAAIGIGLTTRRSTLRLVAWLTDTIVCVCRVSPHMSTQPMVFKATILGVGSRRS